MDQQSPKPEFKVGDEVFLPFWVVLEFLDTTPPTPFIKCQILGIGTRQVAGPQGWVDFEACDLGLGKPDLTAKGIPISYLIHQKDLMGWAKRIADWFTSYPATTANVLETSSHNGG